MKSVPLDDEPLLAREQVFRLLKQHGFGRCVYTRWVAAGGKPYFDPKTERERLSPRMARELLAFAAKSQARKVVRAAKERAT